MRQGNEWAIYQHLLALAPATAPQLAQSTGLSKVTVTGALGNLERLGLVEQVGVREGSAGRQPRVTGALGGGALRECGFMRGLSAGVRSYQRDVARGKAGFRRIIFEPIEFVKNLSYHSTTMPPRQDVAGQVG
ncbi:helix-turn-helix domain-containing protein, partial [Burkholderia gladioli]|nr:helix-turn-helix domain-containing protein [Burkholderia gladioli]